MLAVDAGTGIALWVVGSVVVGVGVEADVEERFSRLVGVLVTLPGVGRGFAIATGCCE